MRNDEGRTGRGDASSGKGSLNDGSPSGGGPAHHGTPLLHRLLLRMHPREYRAEYGAAAAEMLARRSAEARRSGWRARARFQVRETGGLLVSAVREKASAAGLGGRRFPYQTIPRRKGTVMESTMREVRQALRRLMRAPGFTMATVLTLALAIGANAAIFTVVRWVVLAPLPYADSNRIVFLDHGARGLDLPRGLGLTSGLYWQYAQRAQMLETVALYQSVELTATGLGEAETLQAARTTQSLPQVLRVTPQLGRWFDEAEASPGGRPVAVMSHGYWQRRFGGDGGVIGRTIVLNGVATTVIGVMPQGFAFPESRRLRTGASAGPPAMDLWIPHQLGPDNVRAGGFNFGGIARLADGATIEQARAEIDALIARLPEDMPGDPVARSIVEQAGTFSTVVPLKEWMVGSTERTLWILFGAVAIVLLVACANVANLFLVRAEGRQREVAVRRALGAGHRGIAAYFLTESSVLALVGGGLGLAIAFAAVQLLVGYGPADLPRLHEVHVDAGVLAFAALLSVLSAALFGSIPLLRQSRPMASTLRDSGRSNTASGAQLRTRSVLMGTQVALALVLLVASALMARSFDRLRAVDPGFNEESALLFSVALPSNPYEDRERAAVFHRDLVERVSALPGVTSVTLTTCPPLASYCFGDPLARPGRPWSEGEMPPVASMRRVGDDYFSTMGIRLIAGRLLDGRDQTVPTGAAVIDERLAAIYFPGEDPIGQQIMPSSDDERPYEIVGIVGHVATLGLQAADRPPQLYLPLLSHTTENTPGLHAVSFVARTATPPLDLLPSLRGALGELNPDVALAEVTTLEEIVAADRAPMAFTLVLILIAGGVALLLGIVGIYGVISYAVSQRSGEIGVRLALGAKPGDVARMILGQGGRVAAIGLGVGLLAAVLASGLIEALLFDVNPTDPATYAVVAGALLAVALLACWVPARRAAKLDPVDALRVE